MTKAQIITAINEAAKAWEHTDTTLHWSDTMDSRFAAMQTIFLPVFEFIKADTNNFTAQHPVPWYHNYFSDNQHTNADIVTTFWTMSAGCFE